MLDRAPMGRPALIGGGVSVLLVVVTLMLAAPVLIQSGGVSGVRQSRERSAKPEPVLNFVEARFVRLGTELPKMALPDRAAPVKAAGPRPVSATPRPHVARATREPAVRERSVEDLLASLGERADVVSQRDLQVVGQEDGVEGGTAREADEAESYRGRLYVFFRRGFRSPAGLTEEQRGSLRATATIRVGPSGRVLGYSLAGSGHREFDQAVRLRLDQATGSVLPTPPESQKEAYFGRSFPIGFTPPR